MARPKPKFSVRKPPSETGEAGNAEAFVAAAEPPVERSDARTSGRRNVKTARSVVARKDGRTLRRMTIYLPVESAKRLAVHCAENNVDISEVVAELVGKRFARGA